MAHYSFIPVETRKVGIVSAVKEARAEEEVLADSRAAGFCSHSPTTLILIPNTRIDVGLEIYVLSQVQDFVKMREIRANLSVVRKSLGKVEVLPDFWNA